MRTIPVLVGILFLGVWGGEVAYAHSTKTTLSSATIRDKTVEHHLVIPAHYLKAADTNRNYLLDASELVENREAIARYFLSRIGFETPAGGCTGTYIEGVLPKEARKRGAVDFLAGLVLFTLRFDCPERISELTIRFELFSGIERIFTHLLEIRVGEEILSVAFNEGVTRRHVVVEQPTAFGSLPEVVGLALSRFLDPPRFFVPLLLLLLLRPLGGGKRSSFVAAAFGIGFVLAAGVPQVGDLAVPQRFFRIVLPLTLCYVALENLLGVGLDARVFTALGLGSLHGWKIARDLGALASPEPAGRIVFVAALLFLSVAGALFLRFLLSGRGKIRKGFVWRGVDLLLLLYALYHFVRMGFLQG